jgi:ABC-type bacteriocin/lantibiotic exporter with double-glycine peptidase domain
MSWIPSEIRWLSRQVWPFAHWHLASFFCISASSIMALLAPLVLKGLIDQVLPSRRAGYLLGAVVLIFFCQELRAVLSSVGGFLTVVAAQRLGVQLRLKVLRHLDTLSADYYERTAVGTLMCPLNEPIDEIALLGSDLLPAILRTLLATLLTLGTMLLLNARMTLVIVSLIPIFLVIRRHFGGRLEADSEAFQANRTRWSSFLEEHFSSIIALQLLRKTKAQERSAHRYLGRAARSLVGLFRTGVRFTIYTSLTITLAMSAVVGYGGWNVLTGTLTIGGLVAFYTYLTQLFEPLSGAAELYLRAQKTFASIRQVQAIFALEPAIKSSPHAVKFPDNRPWAIDIANLTFAYAKDRGLLSIPRLQIAVGEFVAIVGENGAGKSTLAKLLARLYDPSSGSICVAGRDIREIEIDSLREHVCYAPSSPFLLETTLADNLRMGNIAATDTELWEAVEHVRLASWVRSSHGKLHERLGPGGSRMSAGQRQRLGIARTVLQRPRILVLDEATSSIDAVSEQAILRQLRSVLSETTVIVISHRPSALLCVERIIVLEAGRVVADDRPRIWPEQGDAFSRLSRVGTFPGTWPK